MGEPVRAYGDPVLSAFDLDFLDGGQRRRTALGAGWNVRFEAVPPVRGFRWSKSDRSFPGWYYAVTTGDHVGYESWLERDRLILLDFDPEVVGIASSRSGCTGATAVRSDGTPLTTSYGWPTVAPNLSTSAPGTRSTNGRERPSAATERACSAVGWEFVHAGVPDPVLMANLRWLARYRHRRCGREAHVAEDLMGIFRQPHRLRAGAEEAGDVLRVLPVLFHLLWTGALRADLGGALLSSGTVVHAPNEIAGGLGHGSRGHGPLLRPRPGTRREESQMRRLSRPASIRAGDRVQFAGQTRAVLAVAAQAVMLSDEGGSPREVPLAMLLADESFKVISSPERMPLPPVSLLEALPQRAREPVRSRGRCHPGWLLLPDQAALADIVYVLREDVATPVRS